MSLVENSRGCTLTIHTALAHIPCLPPAPRPLQSFLTLREAGVTADKLGGVMAEEGSLSLLQPKGMDPQSLRDLRDWQALRGAYLVGKYGVDTLARAAGGPVDENEGQVCVCCAAFFTKEFMIPRPVRQSGSLGGLHSEHALLL